MKRQNMAQPVPSATTADDDGPTVPALSKARSTRSTSTQTEHEHTTATDEVPQIQTEHEHTGHAATDAQVQPMRLIRLDDPLCEKKPCKICNWRHRVLPRLDEGLDEESDEEHAEWEWLSPVRARVLRALHRQPPAIWMQILNTKRLCAGACTGMGIPGMPLHTYFRCPLRDMSPISQEALRDSATAT